jgi:outer membrane protein TolC
MKYKLALLFILMGMVLCTGSEISVFTLQEFVERGLQQDPTLGEKRFEQKISDHRISETKSEAILPKFEISMAWGGVPGIRKEDSVEVFDFEKLGPYFGTDIKVAQPLNLGQLNSGIKAARAGSLVKKWEIRKKEIERCEELQEIYFGYLLALEMQRLAADANTQLNKGLTRLEDLLDEDDERVSQFDLLEFKSNMFEVEDGLLKSENGIKRARLAAQFYLNLADSLEWQIADSLLIQRQEVIPTLEELEEFLIRNHPELKQLEHGLTAKKELMKLGVAKLGPEFFVFGTFNYAKSWAGDREKPIENAFYEDPVNRIDGSLGLGVRYRLNVWNSLDDYKRARMNYRHLKIKQSYADHGLISKLHDQYEAFVMHQKRVISARTSLRAAEAWVKGAAMKYDVDPGQSDMLIKAYKKKISSMKNYYDSVYDYNKAVASLFASVGWTLSDYYSIYKTN